MAPHRQRQALPRGVGFLSAVAIVFICAPLVGLALRTPWSSAARLIDDPAVVDALLLSLGTSLSALAVATVLGVPLAWLFARREFRGRRLLRALTVLPMVLPPVVGGVALLLTFGRRGILGGPIEAATGITLPFTTVGVVIAEAFVAMPFLVVTVESGLRQLSTGYDDVAATLGATRWYRLRRVTLPLVGPSLLAGMALAWARALGEFGATITFAGNLPGRTQTMPLAVYLALESNPPAAYLLSFVLLAISVGVLVLLRDRYLDSR